MSKLGLWIAFALGCFLIFEYCDSRGAMPYPQTVPAAAATQQATDRPPAERK